MASQNIRQRIKDEPPTTTSTSATTKSRRENKMTMAKRGLRSLAIAIIIPVSLTIITICCSGSSQNYKALPKPFWFPPSWALNFFCVASSFFMGLSSWLVWAEGGFHRRQPTALPLCLAQLGLSLAWKLVVFTMSSTRLGLTICVAEFGTLVGCSRIFREVNPIAGDLVKPCLVWVAFLTIINYKLIYL